MATEAEKHLRPKLTIDAKRGLIVATQIATNRAGPYDIELEAGRTFSLPISWFDGDSAEIIDLSGYTAKLQIRSYPGGTPHLSLTHLAGITLAATEPNIRVVITAAQATTVAAAISRGFYDLLLIDGAGAQRRILEGCIAARRAVST